MKLTEEQITSTWISQTGNQSVLCEWDVEGFARAIESAVREQVIEEAAKVCDADEKWYLQNWYLEDNCPGKSCAAKQCAASIRALSEKS